MNMPYSWQIDKDTYGAGALGTVNGIPVDDEAEAVDQLCFRSTEESQASADLQVVNQVEDFQIPSAFPTFSDGSNSISPDQLALERLERFHQPLLDADESEANAASPPKMEESVEKLDQVQTECGTDTEDPQAL